MPPKAIAHPTHSRLLNRAREQLVDAAKDAGIELRQSYARVGKHADHKAGRYAHAPQFQRMRREIRKLRTWLGRVFRDVERKAQAMPEALKAKLEIARRLHTQRASGQMLSRPPPPPLGGRGGIDINSRFAQTNSATMAKKFRT